MPKATTPEFSDKRPNIIWVFGDQHRGQAMSFMGDPNLSTPNLDRLAGEGVWSTSAVGGSPLCCPFRGSLLTSRYPHECVPGHEYRMPENMPTIATAFNDNGYHTAYFGKWHVDGHHEDKYRGAFHIVPPERRGSFQTWAGFENNNAQWDSWVHGGAGEDAFHYRLPGYETDCLTDLFIDYIKEREASDAEENPEPFFAVLSVQPPHNPYLAEEKWMQRHRPADIQLRPNVARSAPIEERARRELAGYYAQIENLDWNLGRIRSAIVEAGLEDNTHIIFFSDHGDMHGSQGQFLKTNPWEESLKIPFIISSCGTTRYSMKQGSCNVPINHVDIAPTTLGLCGIQAPDWMVGTDCSSLRLKEPITTSLPDSAFIQLVVPTQHHCSTDRPWRGVVTNDGWKYVCLEGQPWMLYNLNDDPLEMANHAHNTLYKSERKKLQDRLAQWISDTGDKFALPEI